MRPTLRGGCRHLPLRSPSKIKGLGDGEREASDDGGGNGAKGRQERQPEGCGRSTAADLAPRAAIEGCEKAS
jgi:hypothetical protein